MASLSTGPLEIEQQVRAAGLEAGQIDRHVEIAELAEALDDRLAPPVLPEPRQILERDLEPGQPVVMAHPELAKAQRADEFLGPVHLAELLGGDPVAVLKARGETRERRLVPRGQTERLGQLADLGLAEPGVDERGPHVALPRRLHPRP